MRKWMSERLKRRKKTGEESAKEGTKAPEPLQPRFYDDEPVEDRASVKAAEASLAAPAIPAPVEHRRREEPVEDAALAAPVSSPRRGSRSTAASAPAATASNATESLAETPTPTPTTSSDAKPRNPRRRRSRGGRGGSRSRPAAAAAVDAAAVATPEVESTPDITPVAEGLPPAVPLPSAAPVHTAAAPPRASKGTVVLAIGLPGSGKSSWFKRHNIHPLSSDLLRELLFDDAQEQRFQDLVFSNLRSMLKARLIARRPMNYVDATNLTPHDRQSWIKLAKDYGYDVQGLFFDVPLDVCMERHQRRGRAVPEDVMRKMAGKLKAPTFDEGFSKITVVRVKQKDPGGLAEIVGSE